MSRNLVKLTEEEVLRVLTDVAGLPKGRRDSGHRTIYEAGGGPKLEPSGRFYIDYAPFPGGSSAEVPRSVIASLEAKGKIVHAFPNSRKLFNAWKLTDRPEGGKQS